MHDGDELMRELRKRSAGTIFYLEELVGAYDMFKDEEIQRIWMIGTTLEGDIYTVMDFRLRDGMGARGVGWLWRKIDPPAIPLQLGWSIPETEPCGVASAGSASVVRQLYSNSHLTRSRSCHSLYEQWMYADRQYSKLYTYSGRCSLHTRIYYASRYNSSVET